MKVIYTEDHVDTCLFPGTDACWAGGVEARKVTDTKYHITVCDLCHGCGPLDYAVIDAAMPPVPPSPVEIFSRDVECVRELEDVPLWDGEPTGQVFREGARMDTRRG